MGVVYGMGNPRDVRGMLNGEKMKEKMKVFKVKCEYYLQGKDYNEVLDFIANEDNICESHFIIDEVEGIGEDDIYNHPKWSI